MMHWVCMILSYHAVRNPSSPLLLSKNAEIKIYVKTASWTASIIRAMMGPPPWSWWWIIYLFIYLSVCLFIYFYVYLFIYYFWTTNIGLCCAVSFKTMQPKHTTQADNETFRPLLCYYVCYMLVTGVCWLVRGPLGEWNVEIEITDTIPTHKLSRPHFTLPIYPTLCGILMEARSCSPRRLCEAVTCFDSHSAGICFEFL
jgi:hypothetical protein